MTDEVPSGIPGDDGALRTFGPRRYGSEHLSHVDAPIGAPCGACGVAIKDGDYGVVVLHHRGENDDRREPWHRDCFSVGLSRSVVDVLADLDKP